jgi:ABC-type transport system involved in multi-copper enzyme maturation permease subunit
MDGFGALSQHFYISISLLCVAFIIYCILCFGLSEKSKLQKIFSVIMGGCFFGFILLSSLSFWKLNSLDIESHGNIKTVSCLYKDPVIREASFAGDVANYALKCRNEYESKFGKNVHFTPKFEYSFVDSGSYIDVTFDVQFGNN